MPPLTREQLAARRAAQRRRPLRRDLRALVSAAIPIAIVAVLALVLGVMGGNANPDTGPLASPVPSPELGPGSRPPELVIAQAEGVEVHIPVDPTRVTARAFHSIDDPLLILPRSGLLAVMIQVARSHYAGATIIRQGLSLGVASTTPIHAIRKTV